MRRFDWKLWAWLFFVAVALVIGSIIEGTWGI